jgi:hypothetical protein
LGDQSIKIQQFPSVEPSARLKCHRINPEFRFVFVALNVDMRRFVSISGVEEESIWTRA